MPQLAELRKTTDLQEMSYADKVRHLSEIWIDYPALVTAQSRIASALDDYAADGVAEGIYIGGPARAGKTALYQQFVATGRLSYAGLHTVKEVVAATLPAHATPRAVAITLLDALRRGEHLVGTETSLFLRLFALLRDAGVLLVVLDEFHHLLHHETRTVLRAASESLKTLLITVNVPLLVLGVDDPEDGYDASLVLRSNNQIADRFPHRIRLDPFGWDAAEEDGFNSFQRFLFAYDLALPLERRSHLVSADLAYRMHYATDGIVGYVVRVLRTATKLGLRANPCRAELDLDLLATAFELSLRGTARHLWKENPFTAPVFGPVQGTASIERKERILGEIGRRDAALRRSRPSHAV